MSMMFIAILTLSIAVLALLFAVFYPIYSMNRFDKQQEERRKQKLNQSISQ